MLWPNLNTSDWNNIGVIDMRNKLCKRMEDQRTIHLRIRIGCACVSESTEVSPDFLYDERKNESSLYVLKYFCNKGGIPLY